MRIERFRGALLSALVIVALMAPAMATISLQASSPVLATPTSTYENIVIGKDTAYNVDFTGDEPWVWYVQGDRPPIMAAKRVGTGAVVAAGTVATCRNGMWTENEWDVLLDKAFQWMVSGAENVLWYGETGIDYDVYNDASMCSQLVSALENKGYTVDNTVNGTFDNITASLLAPYDILVIPQMELGDQYTGGDPSLLPDADVQAIENFVEGGKGLLIMEQSDWAGYNYYKVQNKILRALNMGIYFQMDSVYDDTNNLAGQPFQPIVDIDTTTDIGSAYHAATGTAQIGLYNICSLAEPGYGVSISPSCRRSLPGGMPNYTVKIMNMVEENNTYTLTVSDNAGWNPMLSENSLTVPALEIGSVTLTVTIPPDASIGARDNILVTASAENVEISDWCIARVVTIDEAIDDGVAWLAGQQNPDGSWGTWDIVAKTGLALLKLEDHAVDAKYGYGLASPFDPEYPYREHVELGLNYLYANAHIIDIDNEPAGNPDTNGNSKGIYFENWGGHRTYKAGIAMMAITGSRAPDRIVSVPGSPVDGWEYGDVLQDAVDYLAWGQTDWGYGRGGWNYQEMVNGGDRSDQSNTGWAVFGLDFAESPAYGFACTIPPFLKTELNIWIDYIQNPVDGDTNDGGAGYSGPYDWANILRTGHLLYMMAFVGDTAETPRVENAVDYLVRHWNDPNVDPGWRGVPGEVTNYQATFTVMKGLTALGIHEIDGIDWQSEFEYMLVAQQLCDGSWPQALWDSEERILSTEWALLTLQKVVPPMEVEIDIKPGSFPNSINPNSKGIIPVAILTTADFDATTVDAETVRFGPAGAEATHWALKDVDKDGDIDMILHFRTQNTGIKAGDTEAELTGKTIDGTGIHGSDSVRTVP